MGAQSTQFIRVQSVVMSTVKVGPQCVYHQFFNDQLTSATLPMLIVGNIFINVCVFSDLSIWSNPRCESLIISVISLLARYAVVLVLLVVWYAKLPDQYVNLYHPIKDSFERICPILQGIFPVVMSLAFAHRLLTDISSGGFRSSNTFPTTFMAQIGMQSYPILVYLLLKDTSTLGIVVSWTISTAALTIESIYLQSWDHLYNLLGYAFATAILLYESDRHNKAVFSMVHQLQDALEDNHRLEKEASAEELRAMIGNVAHDLKTV